MRNKKPIKDINLDIPKLGLIKKDVEWLEVHCSEFNNNIWIKGKHYVIS